MFQKIKKLPLLLILAILLAIGSGGFAFYQYKELQHFKDAGLFYDANQKQVVLNPFPNPISNILTRYVGINEVKDLLIFKYPCFYTGDFVSGRCDGQIFTSQYQQSTNSSIIYDSSVVNVNSEIKANYYGWFGSDRVDFNILTPAPRFKYNGDYYSYGEKKTYNFIGMLEKQNNNQYDATTKLSFVLDEITDGLITGKIDIFSQDNTNKLSGLTLEAKEKLNAENLYGNYTAKDQKTYDIYLTKNKDKIENWSVKTFKGKFYRTPNNYGNQGSIFIQASGGNYFSNEDWNFKDIIDGQEVSVKAKTRTYTTQNNNTGAFANYYPPSNSCYEGGGGCKPKLGYPDSFGTSEGLFNIESVEKI